MNAVLFLLGFIALMKGLISLFDSLQQRRKFRLAEQENLAPYAPPTTIIVPCKGKDPGLIANLISLTRQNYRDFDIIFAIESERDEAHPELQVLIDETRGSNLSVLCAGTAPHRSQKIHKLLQAIKALPEASEVVVFADSDVRASTDWLKHLVAPLCNDQIGATTGYRWYLPVAGNLWSAIRSIWNMTSANLLFSDTYNFAWGGSMAIRKKTLQELQIPSKWRTGLSDDMILTRAVRQAGLKIKFVPRSLVTTCEEIGGRSLIEWISRQLTIVRIYDPRLWRLAALPHWLSSGIQLLGTMIILLGLISKTAIHWAAWLMLSELAFGALVNAIRFHSFKNAIARNQPAIRKNAWIYPLLHPLSSLIMSWSLAKSAFGNRITWRGVVYEMRSPEETVVIGS